MRTFATKERWIWESPSLPIFYSRKRRLFNNMHIHKISLQQLRICCPHLMQAMWEFVNSYNGHCHFTTVPQSIFSLSSCQEFLMFWDFNWQVLMAVSLQAVSSKVISDMVFSTTLSCLKWILKLSGMGIFKQSLLLRWKIFNLVFIPSTNIMDSLEQKPFQLTFDFLWIHERSIASAKPDQQIFQKQKRKGISWDFALKIWERTYVPLSAGQSTLK